ncbi:unnamed protein product, partial [Sphenostylis stenocarpa]
MDSAVTLPSHSQNHTSSPQQVRINGFLVYTRRKRSLHSANDAAKRLKTEEIKSEAALDAVFKLPKVESQDGAIFAEKDLTKAELNTKKEIVMVNKKPVTVKELFETGLLEGIPVVYVGCKKDSTSELRGIITDGGILCSCRLCNGCKVIPPSQFEIHACNIYKRAAQYICLENGKSLLELLRACRAAPLHTLETTIQNFDASLLPMWKEWGFCVYLAWNQENLKAVLFMLLAKESGANKLLSIKKKLLMEGIWESEGDVNPVWDGMSKNVHRVYDWSIIVSLFAFVALFIVAVVCTRHRSYSLSFTLVVVHARYTFAFITCPLGQYYSPVHVLVVHLSCVYLLKLRDTGRREQSWYQRIHKLIFEEDGLPNGAEVAYYARGQKLLEGIKTRSGIVCRCCNTEISPSQFEVHAGWASRRKPYAYIYTSNGVSLH